MKPEQRNERERDDGAVDRMAARWLVAREAGLSPREAAEFAHWRAQEPGHERALRRAEAGERLLDRLDEVPDAASMRAEVDALCAAHRARVRRWTWMRAAAGLAAAAVVVLAIWTTGRVGVDSVYTTAAGVQRSVGLPDGSTLALRASTEVRVRYQHEERLLELRSGEAFFEVAEDRERPFLVTAGNVTVRAVGTAFTVRRDDSEVEVVVSEGKVLVTGAMLSTDRSAMASTLDLAAGERARIPILPDPAEDVDQPVMAGGDASEPAPHLVFENTTLAEAIDQFNRHNLLQIEIRDPGLRSRTLGGNFDAGNAAAFINLLVAAGDVQVERISETHVVLHPAGLRQPGH